MTRSFINAPTTRRRNRTARRPQAETLEGRLLLSAGDLDLSFGTGGYVLTYSPALSKNGAPPGDRASAVAVYPSTDLNGNAGKIVAGGSREFGSGFEAVRRLPDGSPDPGFGSGGRVVPLTNGQGSDMALDSEGRIVMT